MANDCSVYVIAILFLSVMTCVAPLPGIMTPNSTLHMLAFFHDQINAIVFNVLLVFLSALSIALHIIYDGYLQLCPKLIF